MGNFQAMIGISSTFDGKGISQAQKGLKDLGSQASATASIGHALADIGKTVAAAFAVEKLYEFGKGLLETGEQFDLMRQKTGIAVETLASLKKAASLNGVGLDELGVGLRKFSIAVSDANHGGTAAASAFQALHVSATNSKGTGDILLNVADKFSKMSDGADKAKLATLLFGKAGADLIPTLNEGRGGIEKFASAFTTDFAARAHAFNDSLQLMKASTQSFAVEGLNKMLPTLQEVANAFLAFNERSGKSNSFFDYVAEGVRLASVGIQTLVTDFVLGGDLIVNALTQIGNALAYKVADYVDRFSSLGEAIKGTFTGSAEAAYTKADEGYKGRQLEREKLFQQEKDRIQNEFFDRAVDRLTKLNTFNKGLEKNSLLFGDGSKEAILDRQKEATKAEAKKAKTPIDTDALNKNGNQDSEENKIKRFVIAQKEANAVREDELHKVNYTAAEYKKLVELKKIQAESDKIAVGFTVEGAVALYRQTKAIKDQREELIALEEQQKATYSVGAKEAFHDYLEAAKDVASQTRALFNHAFQGMEDAIVKFVQTGKLNFADLASSIEADLIRIAIRQAAVGAVAGLGSIFGSGLQTTAASSNTAAAAAAGGTLTAANGGIIDFQGHRELKRYSNGGIASTPQHAIFGEGSRPEAYVPLPDGRSIPVSMKGGAGGTSVSVVVNVNSDGTSDSKTTGEQQGKVLGMALESKILGVILQQKRPGGALA